MTELIAGDRCLLSARVHLRTAMCCMARAETSSPMGITRFVGVWALAFAYRSAYNVPTIFHLNVNTHNWVNAMKSCKFIQDYVSVTNRCWIHRYAFHRFIVLVIFQINIYIILVREGDRVRVLEREDDTANIAQIIFFHLPHLCTF